MNSYMRNNLLEAMHDNARQTRETVPVAPKSFFDISLVNENGEPIFTVAIENEMNAWHVKKTFEKMLHFTDDRVAAVDDQGHFFPHDKCMRMLQEGPSILGLTCKDVYESCITEVKMKERKLQDFAVNLDK